VGREFDRNLGTQLYDRIQKDKDGRFKIDDFIKVFLEADEILQSKIETANLSIEEFER
jgi:hypothetical protein